MQLLAGTDAGTGGGVRVRVRGGFCSLAAQDGGGPGGGVQEAGTHTHTGTYTQMLHLPFIGESLRGNTIRGNRTESL